MIGYKDPEGVKNDGTLKADSDRKELEIDNLPPDILTFSDEEVGLEAYYIGNGFNETKEWKPCGYYDICTVLLNLRNKDFKYRYYKRQTEAPSHKEIMTLWWKCDNGYYYKVSGCGDNGNGITLYQIIVNNYFENKVVCKIVHTDWFIGRKSATIPPE